MAPESAQATNWSFLPPSICIWFSKNRWYMSRVTVDRSSVALAEPWKAVSTLKGWLARPVLWAWVTAGVMPPAVTPPQTGGRVDRVVPSRSTWGM
jgi:hypothetical protein